MRILQLDESSIDLEIDLCLKCHPSGVIVEGEVAEDGREMKRKFLQGVLKRIRPAGFVALDNSNPVSLLELMPRLSLRVNIFLSSSLIPIPCRIFHEKVIIQPLLYLS